MLYEGVLTLKTTDQLEFLVIFQTIWILLVANFILIGLNYRIQGHLFKSYWITIVPIVSCFVLQKILTHVKQVVQSGPAFCSCSIVCVKHKT